MITAIRSLQKGLLVAKQPHKCLASADRPHEDPDADQLPASASSSLELLEGRSDRTPSILVYGLLGHSETQVGKAKRQRRLSLKFRDFWMLTAPKRKSQRQGMWNPRLETLIRLGAPFS